MPFEVLRTPQVGAAPRAMPGRERRAYGAARDALRGEGREAGGYRLAVGGGEDYPLCCEVTARFPGMNEELARLLGALT